jgi:sulfate adenylyltransferase subunit 1
MDLLRFITAGSVDDGKSTLIGRLLYDSKNILIDQLEALEKSTKNRTDGSVDLALLTDGLRAEREQGITIDVAYRYFTTPKRKFIIADAPGHVQYTRNMITGLRMQISLSYLLMQDLASLNRHDVILSSLRC